MLFQEKSLLVISDDADFLDVVKLLPYKTEILSDVETLLNKTKYVGSYVVLFDVTTANIDTDAVFEALSSSRSLILVGTHAEMDLIVHYIALSQNPATNYVMKPTVQVLLYRTIQNTFDGKELEEFMAFAGMELKAPLMSVKGFAEVLLRNTLDESKRLQCLQIMYNNAQHMERVINILRLTVSVERGRARFNFDDYPPVLIVQAAVKQLKQQIEDKRQILQINLANDCPRVWADSYYLEIVLTSLLENANRYTEPEGQITLAAVAEDGVVKFSVQDNGVGIRDEDKPRVFDTFFRSEDEQVSVHRGFGMSLYNARNIVLAHKGQIWFESEHGKGSTFYFTIPIATP